MQERFNGERCKGMSLTDFIGQTLDDKYRIERELGRGGMGTVYLATHLGTERPVAVKIIAPQFMQRAEFVERFRREARAAGRLRHPNVVDVTDFGLSHTDDGRVAYLVMEYLDGCTLGEILEEEKNLPIGWTINILEQVCSAVHEAHEQGIIHRDLKPDNIWLEPNQRGGYTVKVLDFGIAKLEEHMARDVAGSLPETSFNPTKMGAGRETIADGGPGETNAGAMMSTRTSESETIAQTGSAGTVAGEKATLAIESFTMAGEAGTLIQPVLPADATDGKKTAILAPLADGEKIEDAGTRLIPDETDEDAIAVATAGKSFYASPQTAELTRVGAVLGTPLYMSPEQCRGEKLDARSDVYSLAVITYQMLSGRTPFEGDFKDVMEAHKTLPPPPLVAKKVRGKIKKLIYSGMAKDAGSRPPTADAFASELRAQSEGIGTLLRRSLTIYSEHLPKFLGLSVLLYIPAIIVTILGVVANALSVAGVFDKTTGTVLKISSPIFAGITSVFCVYLIVGTTTWLVNQILAYPLRPVRVRPALMAVKKNWKKLIGTGILHSIATTVGLGLCIIPGLVLYVLLALVSPVVMMENLKGMAAFKRSKMLVMRSVWTTIAALLIMFFVPACIGGVTSFFVAVTIKAFSPPPTPKPPGASTKGDADDEAESGTGTGEKRSTDKPLGIVINGNTTDIKIDEPKSEEDEMMKRVKEVTRESSTSILMLPFQILIASLSSIIGALLYLKTRQAGGESMQDLLEQFEETGRPRKKWQERVRQRLIQSGRITSKSS